MADANHIRAIYDRYPELVSKGDVDGIVALYAEDAWIEDPVGSERHQGIDAVRAFYQAAAGTIVMKRTGPPRVVGSEAATPFVALLGPEGQQKALDVISLMTFDEAGKITSMRAWWSLDALRDATPEDLAAGA